MNRQDTAAPRAPKKVHQVSRDELVAKMRTVEYLQPAGLVMTVCIVQMTSGFVVIGKSLPNDPAKFDADVGRKFAFEDAVRQLWPLEIYAQHEHRKALGEAA